MTELPLSPLPFGKAKPTVDFLTLARTFSAGRAGAIVETPEKRLLEHGARFKLMADSVAIDAGVAAG